MVCFANSSLAQKSSPVNWSFKAKPSGKAQAILTFTASVANDWHIYSQYMEDVGPQPTQIIIARNSDYALVGKTEEQGKAYKFYDSTFMIEATWLSDTVVFSQKIKLNVPHTFIKGKVIFMSCTHDMCLLPEERQFNIEVTR